MSLPQPFQYQGSKRALAALIQDLIPLHGGYRKLKSFQVEQLVYDVTVRFCAKNLPWAPIQKQNLWSRVACQDGPQREQGEEYLDALAGDIQWRGQFARTFGKPRPNAVKFFSSIELITLLSDPDWLDDATKTIVQFWRRKNARRRGLATENDTNVAVVIR